MRTPRADNGPCLDYIVCHLDRGTCERCSRIPDARSKSSRVFFSQGHSPGNPYTKVYLAKVSSPSCPATSLLHSADSSSIAGPSWSKYTYTASIENQTSYSRVTEVLPSKNVTLGMPPSPSKATQGMRNVLYFTNWYVCSQGTALVKPVLRSFRGIYGANYQPQMLPVDQVTHLLYAFGNIAADGTM